jgi:hypothetical protein
MRTVVIMSKRGTRGSLRATRHRLTPEGHIRCGNVDQGRQKPPDLPDDNIHDCKTCIRFEEGYTRPDVADRHAQKRNQHRGAAGEGISAAGTRTRS